jgi:hypothetical protein
MRVGRAHFSPTGDADCPLQDLLPNGRSELIFGVNQPEDCDGFVLYDANLNKRAGFMWSYN